MAKFCDLPPEIHIDIIERALDTSRTQHFRYCQMNNFSLVCKYLYDIMAPKIFRTYRLRLRERCETKANAETDRSRCFLTGTPLSTWNEVGFDARLEHLRKKAMFVRELRIVDHGQPITNFEHGGDSAEEQNRPAPRSFDPSLVPALLETLKTLSGVASVALEGAQTFFPTTHLPEELWRWLSRLEPEKVSFDGFFAFPSSLERLPSVRSLSLMMSHEASRVLEVVRPAHLDIRVETVDRLGDYFKEIFEPYPSLEQLDVRFRYYDDTLFPGYFDFTSHPKLRVAIHMMVKDVEAYIEAPNAWAETQHHLNEIFFDDFTKLDVRRDDGSDTIVISRPLPGQPGGVRELHIPERDEDKNTLLVFEQAVFAALSESDFGRAGPLGCDDTAFWAKVDELMGTVSETFGEFSQGISA